MSIQGNLIRMGITGTPGGGGLTIDGPLQVRGEVNGSVGRGKTFYVDSVNGSANNGGKSPTQALATLDQAINKCTADQGDTIIVLPKHAETISAAAGFVADVDGIRIVGKGWGDNRPTFTFDTAITADVDVSGNSVWIENLVFVNGIDNLTAPIHLTGDDITLVNIETRDNNSSFHCDDFILATTCDRLQIYGWVHRANGGKVGAQTAISIVGGNDIIVQPVSIDGNFATACIENVTTACDSLQVFGSALFPAYLRTRNAADVIFTAVATTKGRVGPFLNARLQDDAANVTEAFVGADMEFFQPINIVNADGESSLQTNITASTDA